VGLGATFKVGLGLCWDKGLELGWFRVRVALGARVKVTGFRVGLGRPPPEDYLAADKFLAVAT
jgi:hypothetical protein